MFFNIVSKDQTSNSGLSGESRKLSSVGGGGAEG